MIDTIHTTFSTYEIDWTERKIKKVQGQNPDTPRQIEHADEDGWARYSYVTTVVDQGEVCLLIGWDDAGHCTVTSPLRCGDVVTFRGD